MSEEYLGWKAIATRKRKRRKLSEKPLSTFAAHVPHL